VKGKVIVMCIMIFCYLAAVPDLNLQGYPGFNRNLLPFTSCFFHVAVRSKTDKGLLVLVLLDHTKRNTTFCRSLCKRSTRRRCPYRAKHNNQRRETSFNTLGFEPINRSLERRQTHALDNAAPEVGFMLFG
jgi:hypothetical protein